MASAESMRLGFDDGYRALLAQADAQPREQALAQAYALGRTAAKDGISITDVLMVHQSCRAEFVKGSHDPVEAGKMADLLLQDVLCPYDVILRGIEDASASLRNINQLLEKESRRIGQALHDEAGQLIATLSLAIDCIECPVNSSCGSSIQQLRSLASQTEILLRRLSHELRPVILDEAGLVPAIQLLADGFSQHRGVAVEIQNDLRHRPCPMLEWSIYRMVQVTLPNVVKHAQANNVTIRLASMDEWFKCSVIDDGVGMPADRLEGADSAGIGLIGVRERAEALGGRVVISPVFPHGTEVAVYLPRMT
jgi:signal transduction histidine kinase